MLSILLPWPPATLSPNSRLHWAQRAKAVKAYRTACAWCASVERDGPLPPAEGPLSVVLGFRPPDSRRRDWDGLLSRMKSGLDGIADGLGVNDSRFRPALVVGAPIKGGAVMVVISWNDAR